MSDQPEQPRQTDQPDDSEPTPGREAELRAAYEANVAAGKAPYEGVHIRTRGELQWVMRERDWSGAHDPGGKERADLRGADFFDARLEGAQLRHAHLERANLGQAHLENTRLGLAHLEQAVLLGAHLESSNLFEAHLEGADLRAAHLDARTNLYGAMLDFHTLLADVVWNGAALTRIGWEHIQELGDEYVARQTKDDKGKQKDKATRLREHQDALLASRQVATVLLSQGLNEDADRYAYRAQVLQRQVLRRQGQRGRAFGSWLLDAVAGYGYKWGRTLTVYLFVIFGFAVAYWLLGPGAGHTFQPDGALVFSVTSFHGRGFFPGGLELENWLARLAALEAVVGLFIEVTFIATFTQRFFAR